jgi:hypothetical protein
MLSEFAISKPLKPFNQVHMDPEETLLDSIDAVILCPGPKGIPGQLHLASRSIYFQPSESQLGLLRFKFSDEFVFAQDSLKQTLNTFALKSNLQKQARFWEDLWFILFRKFSKKSQRLSELRSSNLAIGSSHIDLTSGNKTVFRIRSSKLVVFERNPPKGYSVHHLKSDFHFLVDGFISQRESFSGALAFSNLSVPRSVNNILISEHCELISLFENCFANAIENKLLFVLHEKNRVSPEKELNHFRLFRFSSILKKLIKHLKEDPVIEKLKEVRFDIFKVSIKRFGMALFEPDLSISKLGIAKGRNKNDVQVATAKDLQRNLEFLNFKLTVQYKQDYQNFNVRFCIF